MSSIRLRKIWSKSKDFFFPLRIAGNKSFKKNSTRYSNVNEFLCQRNNTFPLVAGRKSTEEIRHKGGERKTRRFVAKKVAFRYAITRREFVATFHGGGNRSAPAIEHPTTKNKGDETGRERQLSLYPLKNIRTSVESLFQFPI